MLLTAIGCFVLAAMFGLILLTAVLKDQPTPKPVVIIHGTIAALGILILLTYAAMGNTTPLFLTSLVLFVVAALGGLTMFIADMQKKPISKVIALLHPLLAVTALITLIICVLKSL